MFILILSGLWDLALDIHIMVTDMDGATEDGATLDMLGDTQDTGGLDGDILVTGVLVTAMATTTILTTMEEEALLLIMAEEIMPLTEAIVPIEIIQPIETTHLLTETIEPTEVIPQTDKIVFLTIEEVLL